MPSQTFHTPPPHIMGILNLTPDSFSDGNKNLNTETILNRAESLIADGAHILDIGAESTRPDAIPLTAAEEWQRLQPHLEPLISLAHQHHVKISLDTRHPATAEKAIALGIDILNDVTGFTDPAMQRVAASCTLPLIVMHSLSVPVKRDETLPEGSDPIAILTSWWQDTTNSLTKHGISKDRLILDPGIGFGKSPQQSLDILRRIDESQALESPILVGHSRKSFLTLFTDKPASKRDPETHTITALLAHKPITYFRVHDVKGTATALAIAQSLIPNP